MKGMITLVVCCITYILATNGTYIQKFFNLDLVYGFLVVGAWVSVIVLTALAEMRWGMKETCSFPESAREQNKHAHAGGAPKDAPHVCNCACKTCREGLTKPRKSP